MLEIHGKRDTLTHSLLDSENQCNFRDMFYNLFFFLKPSRSQAELQYEEQFQLYIV